MLYLSFIVYFLLVSSVIGLAVFSAIREAVVRQIKIITLTIFSRITLQLTAIALRFKYLDAQVKQNGLSGGEYISRNLWMVLLVSGLLVLPPVFVWLYSGKNILDGFDDAHVRHQNDQVTDLLLGERLVPPAALPPEMFETQEVLRIRPSLIDASRNWQLLDSDFSQNVLLIFKIMKERYGYDMAILEGYRSPERQNALARMGTSVTNATAFQSYHQFGLAADCAFRRDGKLVISEKDPWAMRGYQLYGEVAESLGLHWGGRWKMMDLGHIELRKNNTVKH